jgi:hypothetical protein
MNGMIRAERIRVLTDIADADANILLRYAIETADWIWHPECPLGETAILDFVNEFDAAEDVDIRLHVTADQRYELFLDGEILSRGPDRADPNHWSFASYRLAIPAGPHALRARVVWLGAMRPYAQMSLRGGFLLKAEGLDDVLDTGRGRWTVSRVRGIHLEAPADGLDYHVIGPGHMFDAAFSGDPEPAVEPAVIGAPPWKEDPCGEARPGWRLHPSPLPDQFVRDSRPGRIRAVYEGTDPIVPAEGGDLDAWSPLLRGEAGEPRVEVDAEVPAVGEGEGGRLDHADPSRLGDGGHQLRVRARVHGAADDGQRDARVAGQGGLQGRAHEGPVSGSGSPGATPARGWTGWGVTPDSSRRRFHERLETRR